MTTAYNYMRSQNRSLQSRYLLNEFRSYIENEFQPNYWVTWQPNMTGWMMTKKRLESQSEKETIDGMREMMRTFHYLIDRELVGRNFHKKKNRPRRTDFYAMPEKVFSTPHCHGFVNIKERPDDFPAIAEAAWKKVTQGHGSLEIVPVILGSVDARKMVSYSFKTYRSFNFCDDWEKKIIFSGDNITS
ncbi:MAG: hypothetical protein K2Q12_00490 [Rickettsiales bacterium]|nr:hypothetical protein [Rickettsiales bacterium]